MIETLDLQEFYNVNHLDILRLLRFKGIKASDLDDLSQNFYLRLSTRLRKFDPGLSSYVSFICLILDQSISEYFQDSARPTHVPLVEGLFQSDEFQAVKSRVGEFEDYIREHGGRSAPKLLEELQRRIKGNNHTSYRSNYKKFLKEFQSL